MTNFFESFEYIFFKDYQIHSLVYPKQLEGSDQELKGIGKEQSEKDKYNLFYLDSFVDDQNFMFAQEQLWKSKYNYTNTVMTENAWIKIFTHIKVDFI